MLPTCCPPTIWTISPGIYRNPCILAADDFLGACKRKTMTPQSYGLYFFSKMARACLHKLRFYLGGCFFWGGSPSPEKSRKVAGTQSTPLFGVSPLFYFSLQMYIDTLQNVNRRPPKGIGGVQSAVLEKNCKSPLKTLSGRRVCKVWTAGLGSQNSAGPFFNKLKLFFPEKAGPVPS